MQFAFYYHFEDIYSLIDWIFKEEVSKIINNFNTKDLEELLYNVFDYVEKNSLFLNYTYNSFGREKLKKYYIHIFIIL